MHYRKSLKGLLAMGDGARDVVTILETDPGLNRRSYPSRRVPEWVGQMDLLFAGSTFDFHQWRACKAFTRFQANDS